MAVGEQGVDPSMKLKACSSVAGLFFYLPLCCTGETIYHVESTSLIKLDGQSSSDGVQCAYLDQKWAQDADCNGSWLLLC